VEVAEPHHIAEIKRDATRLSRQNRRGEPRPRSRSANRRGVPSGWRRQARPATAGGAVRAAGDLAGAVVAFDGRRGGRSAAAAASSIERALIGSTVSKSVLAQAFRHARAEAEFPASRINGQIGRNGFSVVRMVNDRQTRRDIRSTPSTIAFLRKMQENPLAQGFARSSAASGSSSAVSIRVRQTRPRCWAQQRGR